MVFVTIEHFCITILLFTMTLIILLILFHYMDTILLVILVCLARTSSYIKLF